VSADKQRRYRDRQRGGPPRAPLPCGTLAAYRRHIRAGTPVDQACRDAYNAAQRAYYHKRKRGV
jgi:hypothetical protein